MDCVEYRPDVDGLRAVAVLLVLFYHAGFGFSGGFVGVDVFFVISGFLITRLILKDQEAGVFSLSGFWIRRIRRILPAATCMVAVVFAIGTVLLLPRDLRLLGESALAQQLMLSNVYFWLSGGYFDGPAELKPLLHTWSLAVEEQFYLIFPVVLVLGKKWPRTQLAALIGGLALLSLVLSEYAAREYPSASFYLLPTRAWELLIGALLVFLPTPRKLQSWHGNLLSGLGLCGIFGSSWMYTSATRFPGAAALLPCAGAALFIYSGSSQRTWPSRILSLRPMVLIGLISYSLYLWHWPIFVFLKRDLGVRLSLEMRVGAALSSLVAAYLSWIVIEKPFRYGRWFTRGRTVVATAAASLTCTLLAAGTVVMTKGLPSRFPESVAAMNDAQIAGVSPNATAFAFPWNRDFQEMGVKGDPSRPTTFLVWGDSHALCLKELCDSLGVERGIRGALATRAFRTPLLGAWGSSPDAGAIQHHLEWGQQIVDFVIREHVQVVIIVARWELKLHPVRNADGALVRDGNIRDAETTENSSEDVKRVLREGLKRTVSRFQEAGAKVWLVRQVPVQEGDPVDRLSEALSKGQSGAQLPQGVSKLEYAAQQQEMDEVLQSSEFPGLTVLGPGENWFDDHGYSRITDGKHSYYFNADHLSTQGADALIRPLLEPVFDEMASQYTGVH